MHGRVEWMVPADDAILSLLGPPKPLELPAAVIARNTSLSKGYVRSRCRELVARGLVEKSGERGYPYYKLTDLGRRAVNQEVSGDELEELTELEDEEENETENEGE